MHGSTKTMHLLVPNEFYNGNLLFKDQYVHFAGTLDHSHVQSNKCIKGEGVVVGLKEDWPSCSLELKFGRARNCTSVVINLLE